MRPEPIRPEPMRSEPMRLDVLSDPVCPWCWIGRQHMQAALAELARDGLRFAVAWRPFRLNPDMPRDGLPRDDYRRAKFGSMERSRELDAEVAAAARGAGLVINLDRIGRMPSTLDAHRLIRLAGAGERQDAVVARLFQDFFVNGRDIGDGAVLADAAAAAGMDRTAVAAHLAGGDGRAEVEAEDAALRAAGLRGVPAFVLEDRVLFTGAVPAGAFADGLARACRVLDARRR